MNPEDLAANQLFAEVEASALEDIAALLEEESFEPETLLFSEGQEGDCMFLVLEGNVRISKAGRGGKQEVLTVLGPGSFFGEMSLFDSEPRSAQATVQEAARLVRMNGEKLSLAMRIAADCLPNNFVRSIIGRLRSSNQFFIQQLLLTERMSLVGTMAGTIIHDFKNPMSTIVCACDFLKQKGKDPLISQMAGLIQKSVDRMLNMTQELLDFSKGEANLHPSEEPVARLVQDLEEQAFVHLAKEKITLVSDIRFTGTAVLDFPRFERVLLNIVKNAREAMPEGGTLHFAIREEDGILIFEVADTGCGMPESVRERIFEPFVTHGKSGGTGLGMSIVKNVIDAHKGEISVESEEGKGTRFVIRVPLRLAGAKI